MLAGCSALPPSGYPAHVDYRFDVRLTVGADGSLPLPASQRGLVVRALEVHPAPTAERFTGGVRALSYPPHTEVRARGEVRAYRRSDGSLPTLPALVEGAGRPR